MLLFLYDGNESLLIVFKFLEWGLVNWLVIRFSFITGTFESYINTTDICSKIWYVFCMLFDVKFLKFFV